jgi:hypothetical protein
VEATSAGEESANFTTPEASDEDLGYPLLNVLPGDGNTTGNLSALTRAARERKRIRC